MSTSCRHIANPRATDRPCAFPYVSQFAEPMNTIQVTRNLQRCDVTPLERYVGLSARNSRPSGRHSCFIILRILTMVIN